MTDYPNPTEADLASPLFQAVWHAIRGWDIERTDGDGTADANGSDVMHILAAIRGTAGLHLFHVQDTERPMYVVAEDWAQAVESWRRVIRTENDLSPDDQPNPDGISRLTDTIGTSLEFPELLLP